MKNSAPNARDVQLWKRLLLVAVTGSVPLFIVSLVLITRYYSGSIDFVSRERHGIAFQRPLEQLIDLVPRYNAAARELLAGDSAAGQQMAALRQKIDAYVKLASDNYNGDPGRIFGFNDANLSSLGRDKARLAVLQSKWNELREAPPSAAGRDAAAEQMVDSVREMIRHAGDFSYLILDDRLNSYYIVDITLMVLPRAQQRLSDAILEAGDLLRKGLTEPARMRLAVLAALIEDGDQNHIVQDAHMSIAQDKVHGDSSESLYRNVPPAIGAYVAADEEFLGLLRRAAAGEKVQPEELEAAGWKARGESLLLWQVCEDELDLMLSKRIQFIQKRRMQYYFVIGMTLAVAAAAMGWVIRSLLSARYAEMLKNEETLRSSAEKFSKAFSSNPSGLSISDLETGRFVEVNESLCRLYNFSPREMVGRSSVELGIFRSEEERGRMLALLSEEGSLRDHEIRTQTREGDIKTILINAEKIHIGGKQFLVSSIKDITDKNKAEDLIREKQAQLILAMDIARLAHWEFDLERNLVTGDENIFRMFSTTSEKEGGLSMSPERYIQRFVHPADAGLVANEVSLAIATTDPNFARQFEHRIIRADGTEGVMMTRSRIVIGEGGRTSKIHGTNQDITEQKQAQDEMVWKTAFLEAQVYSALDGILVVDDRTRRILQNPRLFELFRVPDDIAHDSDDSKLLRHLADQARDPKQFGERVAYLYAHRDEIGRDEIELRDGSILDRHSAPVRDKAGKYYGRIWTFRDITDQRKLEKQLRQAQKMEAIGTLAGGVAHDFNNILTGIMGYTELLQSSLADNPECREYLTAMAGAGERAKSLVRQILTFSRHEETQREHMNIVPVITEAMKFLRSTIPSTIEIEVDAASDTPPVLADATQVHQVLMNLGTNAWHAMKGRAGKLSVKLQRFDVDKHLAATSPQLHQGSYARLSVSDTGKGMDEATLSRIFEPFFTTKVVGEGTGLGLSVVHGIMQSHDGAITVHSKPGEGTTFQLFFPAHEAESAAVERADSPAPRGRGESVLYVDDEISLALLGKKILERLNYSVEASADAMKALDLLRTDPARFDLVIVDHSMPVMTGIDFAREARQIRPDLPIILTSGFFGQMNTKQLRANGIRDILPKPPTIQSVGALVRRVLDESASK